MFPIILQPHQLLHLVRIPNLYPRNPPLVLRPLVDRPRLIFQLLVRCNDLPGNGRHDIGSGFDGLNGADGVAG